MMVFICYLIAVNAAAYALFGYDKSRAVKRRRRVPEKRLFLLAVIGGAAGAWAGMRKFRHKTKHLSFTLGIPALLALNLGCIYFIGKLLWNE